MITRKFVNKVFNTRKRKLNKLLYHNIKVASDVTDKELDKLFYKLIDREQRKTINLIIKNAKEFTFRFRKSDRTKDLVEEIQKPFHQKLEDGFNLMRGYE